MIYLTATLQLRHVNHASPSLQGLKTGMYYLRTKPAANPIQFTLNKEKLKEAQTDAKPSEQDLKERNTAAMVCSLENRDDCLMCGS